MKKILAATDFSKASRNAVDYAAHLAIASDSELVLFHAFHVPVNIPEAPYVMPTLPELEAGALVEMEKIANDLKSRFAGIKMQLKAACGFALEEIENYVSNTGVDLLVMGMRGAGIVEEKLSGSVTTSLIQRAEFPVLVIAENVTFKTPGKIVFATDYHGVKKASSFEIVKEIVHLYQSHLYVLNITQKNQPAPVLSQAVEGIKLDHILEGTEHLFLGEEHEDVIEGINHFVRSHNIDMVVLMPGEHSFLSRVFHETHTKRMAYHSTVPLLTLKK